MVDARYGLVRLLAGDVRARQLLSSAWDRGTSSIYGQLEQGNNIHLNVTSPETLD
jgi:hypothetical protein